jgi:hypothetical protein
MSTQRKKVTALPKNPVPQKRTDTSQTNFEITNSKHVKILKNRVFFLQPPSRMHAAAAAAAAATKQNSHLEKTVFVDIHNYSRTFTGIEDVMCAASESFSGDRRLHRNNIETFISHDNVIWQCCYALEFST